MALENGIKFIEINAKEYVRVEQAFRKISETILDKVESGKLPLNQVTITIIKGIGVKAGDQPNTRVLNNTEKNKKKEGCC